MVLAPPVYTGLHEGTATVDSAGAEVTLTVDLGTLEVKAEEDSGIEGVALGVLEGLDGTETELTLSPACLASPTSSCFPLLGVVSSPHFSAAEVKVPP